MKKSSPTHTFVHHSGNWKKLNSAFFASLEKQQQQITRTHHPQRECLNNDQKNIKNQTSNNTISPPSLSLNKPKKTNHQQCQIYIYREFNPHKVPKDCCSSASIKTLAVLLLEFTMDSVFSTATHTRRLLREVRNQSPSSITQDNNKKKKSFVTYFFCC